MKSARSTMWSLPFVKTSRSFSESKIRLTENHIHRDQQLVQGDEVLRRLDRDHPTTPLRVLSARRSSHRWRVRATAGMVTSVIAVSLFATSSWGANVQPLPSTAAKASLLIHGKCVGVGKPRPNTRLYTGFRCSASSGGYVWVKIRSDGRKACWSRLSLAAITAGCLVTPGQG